VTCLTCNGDGRYLAGNSVWPCHCRERQNVKTPTAPDYTLILEHIQEHIQELILEERAKERVRCAHEARDMFDADDNPGAQFASERIYHRLLELGDE
jgi:hypothetical protein